MLLNDDRAPEFDNQRESSLKFGEFWDKRNFENQIVQELIKEKFRHFIS
jgi:hypothetical protein